MKSFRLYKAGCTTRWQIAHLVVLVVSGIILAYLTQLATCPCSLVQRTPIRFKFSKASMTRPTPGGQGIHFRKLAEDPPIHEAWIRVGDLVCGVVVEGLNR